MGKLCNVKDLNSSCLECLTYFYNLVFWLLGAGLVALGLYLFIEQNAFSGVTRFLFNLPSIFLLAGGFSMLALGCLPICGALKSSRLALATFSLATLTTSIVLLGSAAFGLSLLVVEDISLNSTATASIPLYTNCSATRDSWDRLQQQFGCCGVIGPQDWSQLAAQLGYVPPSCCRERSDSCGLVRSRDVEVFQTGCLTFLITYEHRQLAISSGVCLFAAMFNFIGCLLSFILLINITSTSNDN